MMRVGGSANCPTAPHPVSMLDIVNTTAVRPNGTATHAHPHTEPNAGVAGREPATDTIDAAPSAAHGAGPMGELVDAVSLILRILDDSGILVETGSPTTVARLRRAHAAALSHVR